MIKLISSTHVDVLIHVFLPQRAPSTPLWPMRAPAWATPSSIIYLTRYQYMSTRLPVFGVHCLVSAWCGSGHIRSKLDPDLVGVPPVLSPRF